MELKYSEYLKKHPRNKTIHSKSHALTLSGTVSHLDILHDFKACLLFLTSQHYMFEKMEHILEVKSIFAFSWAFIIHKHFSAFYQKKSMGT